MGQSRFHDTIDTNLIVHFLLRDNKQYKSVGLLLNEPDVIHHIPDLAITEAVYVLETHYQQERKDIAYILQLFLSEFDEVLEYNRELFELAFPFWVNHSALSFNDCCMAAYAELKKAEPLFTFDKTLAKHHPSAKVLD